MFLFFIYYDDYMALLFYSGDKKNSTDRIFEG